MGQTLEPFAFEADEEDHCETPSQAYLHIAPLLREVAQRIYPDETDKRRAAALLRIYDPYYCLGGVLKKLNKLGFERVYNRNEDFYDALARGRAPQYDVLVTNPPYCEDWHFSEVVSFAHGRGKPWFVLAHAPSLWKDGYTACLAAMAAGLLPFYIRPSRNYNFKTPAPLPPPPRELKRLAKRRCRKIDSFWCVHTGEDAELRSRVRGNVRNNGVA